MVNNFDLIKKHLKFYNEKTFYFIQVIKRKKENPEMTSYSRPIESFYIFDNDHFERVFPHIVDICEKNRARAYIKMNALDANSVGLEAISVLTAELRMGNWKNLSKAFNSACGICGKQEGTEKLYLVDIDDENYNNVAEVENFINSLSPIDNNNKVKMVVPTKNGWHLLTTGFDMQTFKKTYSNVDVHKDGITLLYYPECCDDK
jgi:hypothetical protein